MISILRKRAPFYHPAGELNSRSSSARTSGGGAGARSFASQPFPVRSRIGARTVGSGGCPGAFSLARGPAPKVTFPAPSASHAACGLPALRAPFHLHNHGVMRRLPQVDTAA